MQNELFKILNYIRLHGENDCEFYKRLPRMTKEEVIKRYLELRKKEKNPAH